VLAEGMDEVVLALQQEVLAKNGVVWGDGDCEVRG